jgi:Holin of 3TMs, for gene-transfer release
MELPKIVETLGNAVETLAAENGAGLPQYEPTTPQGKRGYDHLLDALNRLPRPALALMTTGLFLLAGLNPAWFEARMQALAAVPEPMWWIIGAVITFFFGAREAHYLRTQAPRA